MLREGGKCRIIVSSIISYKVRDLVAADLVLLKHVE
jgi:hypothetical protein